MDKKNMQKKCEDQVKLENKTKQNKKRDTFGIFLNILWLNPRYFTLNLIQNKLNRYICR